MYGHTTIMIGNIIPPSCVMKGTDTQFQMRMDPCYSGSQRTVQRTPVITGHIQLIITCSHQIDLLVFTCYGIYFKAIEQVIFITITVPLK